MAERDLHLKYLASVFFDAASLANDAAFPDAIAHGLLQHDLHALPIPDAITTGSFRAVLAEGGPEGLAPPIAILNSGDGIRQLSVTTKRINFTIAGARRKDAVPSWQEFVEEAVDRLSTVLEISQRAGHRLALIIEEVATDGIPREATIGEVARRLLQAPDSIEDDQWQWRVLIRREQLGEMYNLFPRLSGISGQMEGEPFVGLRYEIDVNTVPTATAPRFDHGGLREQFHRLLELSELLAAEVDDLVGDF